MLEAELGKALMHGHGVRDKFLVLVIFLNGFGRWYGRRGSFDLLDYARYAH